MVEYITHVCLQSSSEFHLRILKNSMLWGELWLNTLLVLDCREIVGILSWHHMSRVYSHIGFKMFSPLAIVTQKFKKLWIYLFRWGKQASSIGPAHNIAAARLFDLKELKSLNNTHTHNGCCGKKAFGWSAAGMIAATDAHIVHGWTSIFFNSSIAIKLDRWKPPPVSTFCMHD